MVIAINYADEKFRTAQKFNSKTAVKTGGVDRVEECGTASLDEAFVAVETIYYPESADAGR